MQNNTTEVASKRKQHNEKKERNKERSEIRSIQRII